MNTETRRQTRGFHSAFHRSSHYFRSSQPDTDENQMTKEEVKPSKEKLIDVFEFEPVGFMSHGRW
ncbi:MAG: hypothetical protein ACPGJI_03280 [Kangiellaceae bacterium]